MKGNVQLQATTTMAMATAMNGEGQVSLPVMPYADPVKVTAAGYPVMRRGRWFVAQPVVLDRMDLMRMLAALDGMGKGDFDGNVENLRSA